MYNECYPGRIGVMVMRLRTSSNVAAWIPVDNTFPAFPASFDSVSVNTLPPSVMNKGAAFMRASAIFSI